MSTTLTDNEAIIERAMSTVTDTARASSDDSRNTDLTAEEAAELIDRLHLDVPTLRYWQRADSFGIADALIPALIANGRKCGHCMSPVVVERGRFSRYCSARCAHLADLARRRLGRFEHRPIRDCPGCGARLIGTRSDTVYCSNACRQRAYRLRNP
jgi:endogenous inhibitor of DNA gyrase (YacG/DUF329 family)